MIGTQKGTLIFTTTHMLKGRVEDGSALEV